MYVNLCTLDIVKKSNQYYAIVTKLKLLSMPMLRSTLYVHDLILKLSANALDRPSTD